MLNARFRYREALSGFAILMTASCVMAPDQDPGVVSVIKAHYAAHATEEEGVCRSPKIDTIQERRLLDGTDGGRQEMIVRYSYFDSEADMDERFDKLVYTSQPCGGIAERRFIVARSDVGYRVIMMGGERRDGERQR